MILLLGDELIKNSHLAVFELVKNAYDADASVCTVSLENLNDEAKARIVVNDDGCGMDIDTIRNVWLEPGTDYRSKQRKKVIRTDKYKRLPLGEKGVGRFAVHKLGERITLITRSKSSQETVLKINWSDFNQEEYLKNIPVEVLQRSPQIFTGSKSGTRIEVENLWRYNEFTRGKVRNLARSVNSLCSSFNKTDDFLAEITLNPDPEDWLSGLLTIDDILEQALFIASGTISDTSLKYDYEFRPLRAMSRRIKGRKSTKIDVKLISPYYKNKEIDLSEFKIGPIGFEFYIFDRDPIVLDLVTGDKAGLKKFLNQHGGVRVYRDSVRVFDFGEPGNDWLNLGGRRVNIPALRVSNNQVIGEVSLDAELSMDLIEKTNREGFLESDAYDSFAGSVLFALSQVEAERKIDKSRLRNEYTRQKIKQPVVEDLSELREELRKRKLEDELGKYLDRIDKQFTEVRDTLLTAAGSGLTLTTVIHEVEKIIKEIVEAVKQNASRKRIEVLVSHLDTMIDGLAYLVRKSGTTQEKATDLINQVLFNTEYRLRAHKIKVTNGLEIDNPDFSIRCTRRLIVSTLTNFIDNSIYWLQNKGASSKRLYAGTSYKHDGKPSLIIADNGPGFTDSPEYLVEPFFTRRPDGMGLGLHIANEVASLHKGRLIFPERDVINLPGEFTGAIIGIEFSEE